MGAEQNRQTFRRFVDEVLGRGNLAVVERSMAEDVVIHHPQAAEPLIGHDAVKAMAQEGRTAFPDIRVEIDELLAADDRLAARLTVTGTNTGELAGRGISGKHATWSVVHLMRFSDGVIVEDRVVFDRLGLLEQLGFVPEAARAGA